MRKMALCAVVGLSLLAVVGPAFSMGKELLDAVKRVVDDKIILLSQEPMIVDTVKSANKGTAKSLDAIKRLDKEWMAAKGIDERIGGFMNNECGKYIRTVKEEVKWNKKALYAEIFVMDRQGCIVAESDKTSDYWQGDEDKFVRSFAGGKGDVFIDEPSFDESSQSYLVQVSVPVKDPANAEVIGALTVGLNLDAISG